MAYAKMRSNSINKKLRALGYEVLFCPAYFLDISPTDNHIFKHIDVTLQDKEFKKRVLKVCSKI